MTIDIRHFVDARLNGPFATFAVCVSTIIFAYSTLLGPISILVYYALWLPWLLFVGLGMRLTVPVLTLAFVITLFVASMVWSDYPSVTLRSALQYASHAVCIAVAASIVSFRSLSRGLVIGSLLVILYSLQVGRYSYDILDGTYTLVGAFGSKNQLGFFASIGLFFGLMALLRSGTGQIDRLVAGLSLPILAYVLWQSESVTSLGSLGVALLTALGLTFVSRLPAGLRSISVPLGWVSLGLVMVLLFAGGLLDVVLGAFGKDSTLTGRTYLWSRGLEVYREHPILGIGYQAFWVQGATAAEELWRQFHIGGRGGFHFHSTPIALLAEVGLLGMLPFMGLVIYPFLRAVRAVVRVRSAVAPTLAGMALMFIVRSFFEVDTLASYQIGSFLVFYAALCPRRVLEGDGERAVLIAAREEGPASSRGLRA